MFTPEKRNAQPVQSKEADAPEANVQKMSPPPFQLKADPAQPKGQGEEETTQLMATAAPVQRQAAAGGETAGVSADGVPPEFLEHLKLREGWRTKVYLDSRGLPTVGLGHLLTASQNKQYAVGASVPVEQLNTWATQDAKKAYDAATSQAGTLGVSSAGFINALASVNFQLGTGWNTKFKKTWSYMVSGQWEKAALEAQDSAWFAQTPVRVRDFQDALCAQAGNTTPKAPAPQAASSSSYDFKIGAATGSGTATGDRVNVRKGPGTTYDKTGKQLSKGAGVTIYGQVDGWYCVGQGQWVSKDFVSTASVKQTPGTPAKAAPAKPTGPDVNEIAKSVYDAMFGGYTGIGTDEEAVYRNLAKLNHDGKLISAFKTAYKTAHGSDVVNDIKSEFSNSIIFGNQLDKALGYLNAKAAAATTATKPATTTAGGSTNTGAAKAKAPTTATSATAPKSNFDVEKAVAALNANAASGSLGKCAKYVRMAINAGGVATPNNPVSAKNYKGYLEKFGFKQISTASYQKGDIAVFEAFQGDSKYHEHGHIQMYNGSQWVSDFKQRDYWAGGDYRKHKPGNVVYRM
jgi:GH24 family phage-related lysozyme (muramidase)